MPAVINPFFTTNQLILTVPNLRRAQTFLADKFFPNIVMSDTEFVSIDVDVGKRRMTPFVSPLVEGKLVEQRRTQTNSFKPPYLKDKRAPDLRKPVMRAIGERIGGDSTGAEREMMNIASEMTDQVDMLSRRIEWMAAAALATGTITVSGDGFPTTVIDFGRDPSLSMVLTGASQWGYAANFDAAGKDPVPVATIDAVQRVILKKSGAVVTDIIFTTTPWSKFLRAPEVQGAIYYPKLGDGNDINPGSQIIRGAVYKGIWGNYNLWVYNDWYVDENDVEQPMLPDGMVLFGGPDLMGARAFGQIMDPEFNYEAMPFAPKTWVNKDPAQRYLLMQSAAIVIPSRVNAFASAMVCQGAYR